MKKFAMLAVCAFLMFTWGYTAAAQEQYQQDDPLAEAEKATPANWYSDILVWKTGKINDIKDRTVWIDDSRYRLAVNAQYWTKDGSTLYPGDFRPGTEVTFVLEQDRDTIVSIVKGRITEEDLEQEEGGP